MDKRTYGMDIWTTLQVDHMPTPPEPLTTWVFASGLTRFACHSLSNKSDTRDLSPLLPDGEGLRDGESFALPGESQVWELSPTVPDGAGASIRGHGNRQEPRKAAFIGLPYPSPSRGSIASWRRFGRVPAVAPMVRKSQPGTESQEGDKSVEAVPWQRLTCNFLQMHQGRHKIDARPTNTRTPV